MVMSASKDYQDINDYKTLFPQAKATTKKSKAFQIMKLTFLMDRIGLSRLLNEQQSIKYQQLRQEKENLIKQLYELMVVDADL